MYTYTYTYIYTYDTLKRYVRPNEHFLFVILSSQIDKQKTGKVPVPRNGRTSVLPQLYYKNYSPSKLKIIRISSVYWQVLTVTIKLSINPSRSIACRYFSLFKIFWVHLPRFIFQLTVTLSDTVTGKNVDRGLATVSSHTF